MNSSALAYQSSNQPSNQSSNQSSGQLSENFINSANRRNETRISLGLSIYIRRTINNTTYFRLVKTENVSWNGVRIICDVPLEIGAELVVSGLKGKFSAVAQVRHTVARQEGGWAIGLEFMRKTGKWVVIK